MSSPPGAGGGFATAVVLAGGRGERVGGTTPKQFLDLAGHPMVTHSIRAFLAAKSISSIVVVLPEDRPSFIDEELKSFAIDAVAHAGRTRQDSLAQGLVCLPDETEIVVVHDAARPLVSHQLIDRVVEALRPPNHGCISAIKVEDALKEVSLARDILSHRSKKHLWRAQTPQAFVRDALEEALAQVTAGGDICEDCSEMLTRSGYRIGVVEGDPWNIKVTRPSDVGWCERLLVSKLDATSDENILGGNH